MRAEDAGLSQWLREQRLVSEDQLRSVHDHQARGDPRSVRDLVLAAGWVKLETLAAYPPSDAPTDVLTYADTRSGSRRFEENAESSRVPTDGRVANNVFRVGETTLELARRAPLRRVRQHLHVDTAAREPGQQICDRCAFRVRGSNPHAVAGLQPRKLPIHGVAA